MKSIVTTICVAFSLGLFAQNQLPEDFPTVEKVVKKTVYNFPKEGRSSKNGGGYSASLKLMKVPPKRVALVSFFTFDPGLTKSYSYSSDHGYVSYTTTVTKQRGATKGSASAIVDGFFYSSVDKLIAQFKENGMDLLVPEQFLDTEAKKQYLEGFTVKHDKFNNFIKNLGSADHTTMFAWPEGTKPVDIIYEPFANYSKSGMLSSMDYKKNVTDKQTMLMLDDENMQNSIGYDLATNLGVDAVLIVYFTIYQPKDTRIVLQHANMILMGPNPLQVAEGGKKPLFYRKGQFYCATRFQPDVPIYNSKKKDPETQKINAKGFDNVVIGLSTPLCKYLTEGVKKYQAK